MGKKEDELNKPAYPSSQYLLGLLMDEYKYEQDRSGSVDNRVGILLSAVAVLMSFYLPALKMRQAMDRMALPIDIAYSLMFLILVVISIVLALSCIILLCSAYIGRNYQRFDFTVINDPSIQQHKPDILARDLINVDISILLNNRKLIDTKYKVFEKGLFAFRLLAIFICITLVMNNFV